jgi:nucleoside 2-deoxyribosyltransferase
MRIYFGFPLFLESDIRYNSWLTQKLRNVGLEVYSPSENSEINNKDRNDITGQKIYLADIHQVENCNVFLYQMADFAGQNWEAGYMDCLSRFVNPQKYYGVIGLATDIRLRTMPDLNKTGVDNQAYYINQFVVGALKLSLGIYQDTDSLITRLLQIRQEKEGNY